MPWQLTNPINVGDLDPNGPYQQRKITKMVHDSNNKYIKMTMEFGNTDGGEWVKGLNELNASRPVIIEINGADYDAFIAANIATYTDVKDKLYEWCADNDKIDPGAVV